MDGIADYESWKAKQKQSAVGAASVVIGAQDQSPDQIAGDMNLANEFGKVTGNPVPPIPMVGEYRSVFQQAIEKKRAETILSSAPRLTEWLRNPENAGVARDDLEGLSWWETGFGATANALERGALRAGPQLGNQYLAFSGAQIAADQKRSFGDILHDARDPIMVDGKEIDRAWVGPSALLSAGYRWLNSRTMPTTSEETAAGAVQFQQAAGEWAKRISQIPMSPGGEAGKKRFEAASKAEGWQAQLSALSSAFVEAPGEMTSFLMQVATESLPTMAASIGVGMATRNPNAMAATMGVTSFATEYGSAPMEFFQEKGVDVSTPEGALKAISDPELMRDAEQRGITRGVVIGVMDGLSGGIAGRALSESPIGNMVLQSITQAAMGSAGEGLAQVAAGQDFNIAEVVLEGLAEFATAPLEVGGMAATKFRQSQAAARDAESRVSLFQELSGQAVSSKLRERMPDRFRQFVAKATENGPVENVYVPAQEFVTYFQSVGLDPFDMVSIMEGMSRVDLDAALAAGGDVKIPTATYAANIAGSEHDAFLMENMRFNPMEMTAREAAEFNERVDEVMAEMWAEAENVRAEDERWRATESKIYDDMVSRLRAAGRSTEVATTEAMVYPAFYRVMAERAGMDTEAFLARYPLPEVRGSIPEGMKLRNVDEITRTIAELRSRKPAKRETPLLDFIAARGGIDDVGGELAARNAEGATRPGQRRLARRLGEDGKPVAEKGDGQKYGWDDVAQAAVEAGFLANDPVVAEWMTAQSQGDRVAPDLIPVLQAAIDRELSGEAQYAAGEGADAERNARLDEIEEYLSRLGVGLDASDDAIRAAIEADQAEAVQMYAQGEIATESEAFKKWFGESKVVDADGKPLVVYHGTRAEFEAFDLKKAGATDPGLVGKAIYMTPYANLANMYGNNVIAGYASIQNPLIIQDGLFPDGKSIMEAHGGALTKAGAKKIQDQIKKSGHDGVLFKFGEEIEQVVAFSPEQIKSVNNRGTWDTNDARVLYQDDFGTVDVDGIELPLNADGTVTLYHGTTADAAKQIMIGRVLKSAAEPSVYLTTDATSSTGYGDGTIIAVDVKPSQLRLDDEFPDGRADFAIDKKIISVKNPRIIDPSNQSPDARLLFQGPRGQIEIPSNGAQGQTIIRLFEKANLSTMLHESGHFFLLVMQDLAKKGEANSVAEYETIKSWWRENAAAVAADGNRAMPDAGLTAADVQMAIDTGTTGDVMKDGAIDVGMQEQWARAFEAYLMEGKAPNIELRTAFEKFRSWLLRVYKEIMGLRVNVSDDIRAVFDRMLASDAEIERAKQSVGEGAPLFATAEQMGLTQEEYDRFLKLRGQAEDEAKARLMREVMDPIKREREKWFKEERALVEAEVARQINALPMFRALEWMGNRRWLGDGKPEALPDMRLSRDVLVDRYGDGVLKTLRRGKQTVYAVDGGLDPDDAAGFFGFNSGDELVKALERAPDRKAAIQAETDRLMNERHGDVLNDGEIEAIALDAVHNDKRGQWIAAELKAVAEVAGVDINLTAKDARATARQTMARMKVRDAMASNRYLAAERKAAQEAERLSAMLARENLWMNAARRRVASKARAGQVDATAKQIDQANASTLNRNDTVKRLIDAKRRQLMNHALYMESRAVADEVGKAERYVQRLNKSTTREKIAGAGRRENAQTDYLAALDEILDRHDFRKMSGRAEDRRGALAAFIDAMKAAGRENELAIPDAVLRDTAKTPYKTLAVEELRGVIDSLKNIEHVATRWNDLIDATEKRNREEVIAAITAAFEANMPKRPPGRVATTGEGMRHAGRQFLDLVLNAGTLLREIDGFEDMGAAYRNLKAPIDQAQDRLMVRKEKATADLENLYSVYSKDERRKMAVREHIPALGYALSKWEKIAVALNTGNEGNMQRLTDPKVKGSLTPAQVGAVLATLDAKDADFIQSVWDYVGSFRDDIGAREKRTTGVEPQWVEASPVVIGEKTLKGGYYPLKYDPRLSSLARDDEAQSMAESLQAGRFGKAQTKRGHLEARAQSSGRDVELDMSVLYRHVNQVIYDLELSEPVTNSWKILQSAPVRAAFMDAGRQADFDALEIWLKDTAEGQLSGSDWINANARRFKSNFTAAKLALNLGTVMAQVTGVTQTMVVVGKKDFLLGLQASLRNGISEEIAAKSSFMRSRQTTFNKDIFDFYNDPKAGPVASRWGDIKREWIGPASFWLMTKVQWYLVDIPSWMAGYQQGLRKYGNDEAKAISHADAVVKRAQASGVFSDRSAIERGSISRTSRQNDVVRLFTTLGSYMFAKFNVAYERSIVAGRTIREEGASLKSAQAAASWTIDVAFLFTLEAVFMALLKGKLPDDEEEDDTWSKFLAKETAMSVLGTVPFVRDVASTMGGFESGGAYGGIVAEIGKPFLEIGQGEIDKGLVKSIINGTGLATGLPAAQINRAVDAGWRATEGDDVSVLEYLLGRRGK